MNRTFCILCLTVLALSCSKTTNPSSKPAGSNGIMQLAVGNSWNYVKVNYDSNTGKAIDTSADAIYIISEVTVDTTTYFQQFQSSISIRGGSFFYNSDSNTLRKIDSAVDYVFFKRVSTDSLLVDSWRDTVTTGRCKGMNFLYGFTDTTNINGYNCLKNVVYVNDCTGFNFQTWVYYLKPGLGLVRILHYVAKQDQSFYLDFQEDLQSYHIVH